MSASCENIARHLLPLYRSFVAKELISNYKFTQVRVAQKLGTTQAAISQYVTSKRGRKGIPNYDALAPSIQDAAAKAAKRIASDGMAAEEFSTSFCELCTHLRKTNKIP